MIEDGALALWARLDSGEVSAVEVMQATLDRIEAVNDAVNAVVSLRDTDQLLAEARAADETPAKGWLHGIPVAIKDTANARGLPTSMGSPLLAGIPAANDDIHVARVRAAGALIIGKTNTPEFGLGSHSFNPVHGVTRNPYDLSRSAGGSSGGAAAALSTAMVSVADGSDIMGSLRNPAGWNNVYGMRPSLGLVPSEPPVNATLNAILTSGPMARNPRDLAALLDTMAGPNPRHSTGLVQDPSFPQIDRGADGLRLGWLADWGGALPMEPGILDICTVALVQMADIGVDVEPLDAPFDRDGLWQAWVTLRSFALSQSLGDVYANPDQRAQMKETAIWEVEQGLAVTARDAEKAGEIRAAWTKRATDLFEVYDVLALPTAQMWPFDVTIDWPREIAGQGMDTYHRWMEVVIPASLIGLPAVSVPVGFGGPFDLPMGLQLIGRHGSDAQLLRLAQAWHLMTDWPGHRPPEPI
jgi:amidase